MAKYEQELEKFQKKYGIVVDTAEVEKHAMGVKAVGEMFNVTMDTVEQMAYRAGLEYLLANYIETKIGMTEGKVSDLSDLNISNFIVDYENLIAAKNVNNIERDKYEGLEFSLYDHVINSLSNYNKPLAEIWADKVTKGNVSFEAFAAFADAENNYIMNNVDKQGVGALSERSANLFMAKKAMDKVWEKRSILWIITHPRLAIRDYNYKKTLNDRVTVLGTKGFAYPEKDGLIHNSALTTALLRDAGFIENNANDKAKAADQNVKAKTDAKTMLEQKVTCWKDTQELYKNTDVREAFYKEIGANLKNCEQGRKEATTGVVFGMVTTTINEFWGDFTKDGADKDAVVMNYANRAFNVVHGLIVDVPGMSAVDTAVAAQKIANIMLITFSPIVTDDKYAQYADNYFLKNATPEMLNGVRGFKGNAQDVLNEARFEIGINDKLQMNLDDAVNDKQDIQKSEVIKEQGVPVKEGVIE